MSERRSIAKAPAHILLATDMESPTHAATLHAVRLAQGFSASITVLHVFDYTESETPSARSPDFEELRERSYKRLEQLAEWIQSLGIPTDIEMRTGIPVEVILKYAQTQPIDLIVTGSHGRSSPDQLLLGSTAEGIIRRAPCAVLTVGPHVSPDAAEQPMFRTIISATDFSDASRKATPLAQKLASRINAKVRLLHVLPAPMGHKRGSKAVEELFARTMQLLVDSSCGEAEFAVCYGNQIGGAIANDAVANNADLIVLGVRRASLFNSQAARSVTPEIISQAPCPVMTIAS